MEGEQKMWNYRIVKRTDESNYTTFSINEVYYHDNGDIYAWYREESSPTAETYDSLWDVILKYAKAFSAPILEERTLANGDEVLIPIK